MPGLDRNRNPHRARQRDTVRSYAVGGKLEWLYTTRLDDRTKGIHEFRVTVMDEVSTVLEETLFLTARRRE